MGIGFGYEVIGKSKATGKVLKRFRFTTLKAAKERKKRMLKMKRFGRILIKDLKTGKTSNWRK